jgi:DNA-binding transcriptional ArsR family regulator
MNTLTELLSSRVKSEIFRLLFGPGGLELHVRDISRRAGLADGTVRQELKRLTGLGVIEMRRAGNRTYYRANVAHPLHPDIRNLVLKTSGLVDFLRVPLTHAGIRLAFVFGSLASGTEMAQSDVDLMVVGTISLRQLGKLLSGVDSELGREVNPHIMTSAEFAQRRNTGDHFIRTVLAGSRLWVIGDEDELAAVGE